MSANLAEAGDDGPCWFTFDIGLVQTMGVNITFIDLTNVGLIFQNLQLLTPKCKRVFGGRSMKGCVLGYTLMVCIAKTKKTHGHIVIL